MTLNVTIAGTTSAAFSEAQQHHGAGRKPEALAAY